MTNAKAWGPYLLILAGAAVGLGVIAAGLPVWAGSLIVAFSLLVAALLRLITPSGGYSLLAVRHKRTDALTYAALGATMTVVSVSVAVQWFTGR